MRVLSSPLSELLLLAAVHVRGDRTRLGDRLPAPWHAPPWASKCQDLGASPRCAPAALATAPYPRPWGQPFCSARGLRGAGLSTRDRLCFRLGWSGCLAP